MSFRFKAWNPFWKHTALPQCMAAVSLCKSATDPHQIRLGTAAGEAVSFFRLQSLNERVKCYAICVSFLGSGNIWWRLWRRGKSLSSSPHTTLKRPGKPMWWDNTFSNLHTEATSMQINTQGQIKQKCRLVKQIQNQNRRTVQHEPLFCPFIKKTMSPLLCALCQHGRRLFSL